MSGSQQQNRTSSPASVAFIHLAGLFDQSPLKSFDAIQELHLSLKIQSFPEGVSVLSASTGAIIVAPDGVLVGPRSAIHNFFKGVFDCCNRLPVRIGVTHGTVEYFSDVVGGTYIGEPVNIAARIATSADNTGVLYEHDYCKFSLSAVDQDPLRPKDGEQILVKGKAHDGHGFQCSGTEGGFEAPKDFSDFPILGHQVHQQVPAFILAVDLPRFSSGARNLLSKRFRAFVDAAESLLAASAVKDLHYSPGGDGGVFVFPGIKPGAHARMILDGLWKELAEEGKHHSTAASVESRIGVNYGTVQTYTNAQGRAVPTGHECYVAEQIAKDITDGSVCCTEILRKEGGHHFIPEPLLSPIVAVNLTILGRVERYLLKGSLKTAAPSVLNTSTGAPAEQIRIAIEAIASPTHGVPPVPRKEPFAPGTSPQLVFEGNERQDFTYSDWIQLCDGDLLDLDALVFTLKAGSEPLAALFTGKHAQQWFIDQVRRFSGREQSAERDTLKQGLLEFLNNIIKNCEIFRIPGFLSSVVDERTIVVAREQSEKGFRSTDTDAGRRLSRFLLGEVFPESVRRIHSINILAEQTANTEALEQFAKEREAELGFLVNFRLRELLEFDALLRDPVPKDVDMVLGYSYSLAPFAGQQEVLSVEQLKRIVKATPKVIESIRTKVLTLSDLQFDKDVVDLFERELNRFRGELYDTVWRESSYYWGPGCTPIAVGLPFAAHTMLLVYNKRLFEKHAAEYQRQWAMELLPPKDWDSFERTVEFFDRVAPSAAETERIWGVCMQGAKEGKWCYYEFLNFAYGDGAGVTKKEYGWHRNKADAIVLDSTETVNATRRYLRLAKMTYEWGDTKFETCDHEKQIAAMLTGRVAMAIMWNDRLFNHFRNRQDDFGFTVIPGKKSMIGAGTYFICRDSANVHHACVFVAKTMSISAQVELSRRGLCSVFREPYRKREIKQRLPWMEAVRLSLAPRRAARMLEGSWDAEQIAEIIMETLHKLKRDTEPDVAQRLKEAADRIRNWISESEKSKETQPAE